jgi:hypothetical protein
MSAAPTSSPLGRLAAGYLALPRAIFGRPAGDAHLRLPLGLVPMLAILVAIGLARDAISVGLGIAGPGGKWYSFDPDIVCAMALWPAQLLFFGVFLIHGGLRLLRVRGVPYRPLLAFFFYLQLAHLLVPFLDILGFALGVPYRFHLAAKHVTSPYHSNGISASLGIIVVWLVTLVAAVRIVLGRFRAPRRRALLALTVAWLVIVAATYVVFPTFNTAFDAALGLAPTKPPAYWGNVAFFLVTLIVGLLYGRRMAAE